MSDIPRTPSPHETALSLGSEVDQLRRELAKANSRIVALETDADLHAHELSPAMVQARNDQLAKELAEAKKAITYHQANAHVWRKRCKEAQQYVAGFVDFLRLFSDIHEKDLDDDFLSARDAGKDE